jgi:hypothetical protein
VLDRLADLDRRGLIQSTVCFRLADNGRQQLRGMTVGVAGSNPDALGAPLRREGWKTGSHRDAN